MSRLFYRLRWSAVVPGFSDYRSKAGDPGDLASCKLRVESPIGDVPVSGLLPNHALSGTQNARNAALALKRSPLRPDEIEGLVAAGIPKDKESRRGKKPQR